jgi:hypothetical protein
MGPMGRCEEEDTHRHSNSMQVSLGGNGTSAAICCSLGPE